MSHCNVSVLQCVAVGSTTFVQGVPLKKITDIFCPPVRSSFLGPNWLIGYSPSAQSSDWLGSSKPKKERKTHMGGLVGWELAKGTTFPYNKIFVAKNQFLVFQTTSVEIFLGKMLLKYFTRQNS